MNAVLFSGDTIILNAVASLVSVPHADGSVQSVSTEAELRSGLCRGKAALIVPRQVNTPATVSANPMLAGDEQAFLILVQQGCSSREIARRFGISVQAAKLRLTEVYRQVGGRLR